MTDRAALEASLPSHLRGPTTTFVRVTQGLSGAGVYRVGAAGQALVLKRSATSEPLDLWRARLALQRAAADIAITPRVVHHDETHRAVITEAVADRGFLAHLGRERAVALTRLGDTLRRLHALPLPASPAWRAPGEEVAATWAGLRDFTVPGFARTAIERELSAPRDSAPFVASHNDPNPSNLLFDGERVLLVDWDAAGPNEPFFDLGAAALFLRLDHGDATTLLAGELPLEFTVARRRAAACSAAMAFHVARRAGHQGAEVRDDDAPTLASVYAALGTGTLRLGTADGLWAFALALARAIDAR